MDLRSETWRRGRPQTGFNSRGVATGPTGNRRGFSCRQATAHLWALDAKSGRPIDSFGTSGAVDALQGSAGPWRGPMRSCPPTVVGNVVIVGPVISDGPQYQLARLAMFARSTHGREG